MTWANSQHFIACGGCFASFVLVGELPACGWGIIARQARGKVYRWRLCPACQEKARVEHEQRPN